jgi:DNA-binding MarR family transcriptional regulator
VSKQTVGSIVDQLEGSGYVRRVPDPTDARARLVTMTDKGRELVEISLPVVRDVEAAWASHLGPTRTRQLRESLLRLRQITDPYPPLD